MVFASDGRSRWSEEVDTQIGKFNAVLHELYCSVATKWELLNAIKLSVFKLVFVPILTYRYSHESWVMTERIITQMQAPKIGFLRRVDCVTQGCANVRWCPGEKQVWRLHV